MKKIIGIIVFLLCIFNFSSCITTAEVNYLQDMKKTYAYLPFQDYKLAVGDVVSCQIMTGDMQFANEFNTLIGSGGFGSKSFTIYEDSCVYMPFLSSVKIAGLTLQDAEVKIEKEIQESIIDAQVQLTMTSNVFYVLAEGKRGAHVVYKENLSIYQALAISGQTTERMDLSRVSIVRKKENGGTDMKTFDLRAESVIQSEFYYIQPNDVIYFPTNKNSFFNVTSLGSFIATVTVPLTLLIYVSTYNFK